MNLLEFPELPTAQKAQESFGFDFPELPDVSFPTLPAATSIDALETKSVLEFPELPMASNDLIAGTPSDESQPAKQPEGGQALAPA